MAAKFLTSAFKLQGISAASKLVLIKLADAANASGYCWPSVARISLETGLSERCVRKHLGLLQDADIIQVERRMQGRRQTSNGYVLLLDITPAQDAGAKNVQAQGMREPDAGDPCPSCTPILPPNKSSNNLPPIPGCDTPAMMARVAAFRNAIGHHHFEAWFKTAVFIEGPPITIQFAGKTARSIAPARYREPLERHFGDNLVVTYSIVPNAMSSKPETEAC